MATWGAHITWKEFKEVFLEKYFPHSVCIQKEIEFLQLWQGEMTVSEYVVKFESLARFSHYLKDNPQNDWKTIKFEEGLKLELQSSINILELRDYPTLVNKCRITEQKRQAIRAQRSKEKASFDGKKFHSGDDKFQKQL